MGHFELIEFAFSGPASIPRRAAIGGQDGQGLIKCREDQAYAAKQLKEAHRQPNSVGNRLQGRHGLRGIGKLPQRAHHGMKGEKDLKNPQENVHGLPQRKV
jgi:hypothetical protein